MKNINKTFTALTLATAFILTGCQDNNNSFYESNTSETTISATTTPVTTTTSETAAITTTKATPVPTDTSVAATTSKIPETFVTTKFVPDPNKEDKPIADGKEDSDETPNAVSVIRLNAGGYNVDVCYSSSAGISYDGDYMLAKFFLKTENDDYIQSFGQSGKVAVSTVPIKSFDTYTLDENGKTYGLVVYKQFYIDNTYKTSLFLIDGNLIFYVQQSDIIINDSYGIDGDVFTVSDKESYRINVETRRLEAIE